MSFALNTGGFVESTSIASRVTSSVAARYRDVPLSFLLPQLFLGVAWFRSAVAHSLEPNWRTGEQVQGFVVRSSELGLPFYSVLVDLLVEPMVRQVAFVVVAVQFALGALLILNVMPRAVAVISMALSTNFIMGGEVNPSVFYIILAMVVLFRSVDASANAKVWRAIAIQSTVLLALVAILCLPFVGSFHPTVVIDDPALVLITVSALFCSSCWIVFLKSGESDESGTGSIPAGEFVAAGQALPAQGLMALTESPAGEPDRLPDGQPHLSVIESSDQFDESDEAWFSVRCHFQLKSGTYEERITIWHTSDFDEAMELAEDEARRYAHDVGGRYLESCDGYRLSQPMLNAEAGQAIYSLARASSLDPAAYLRQFFFTGAERSLYA